MPGPPVHAFTATNVPIAAAPPGYFVPNSNGAAVPPNKDTFQLVFDTTGLPDNQPFLHVWVQLHYTNTQLGVTGLPDQGRVTNTDGTETSIPGGTFTGWIDDSGADFPTTHPDKQGNTVHEASLGGTFRRIPPTPQTPNPYPDRARLLVLSSPGYASVPSVSLDFG